MVLSRSLEAAPDGAYGRGKEGMPVFMESLRRL
jgi:hypothetical protein